MAGLVLDVTWQVMTRYLLGNPSAWTDELATILMIWVASLGASLGFVRKAHLGIDYFVNYLPKNATRPMQIVAQLVIVFFALGVLVYGGSELVRLTLRTEQLSPALGIKMGFVYSAIPISGLFILLATVESLAALCFPKKTLPASNGTPDL